MKIIVTLLAVLLLSFGTQEEKKITLTFTVEEVQLIYDALGELPAKKVEGLRAKIAVEANKQLADTTKRK
jgi:hypothetical protein